MSYPKKTLKLRPDKGLNLDMTPSEIGPEFWTFGQNVQFRNGEAGRVLGSRAVYGTLPVEPVMHMRNARIGQTNYWLFFGEDAIHALETSNSDDVTPAATLSPVSEPWQWSSTSLNGVPAATNGIDAPIYWAGDVGTPFADLPGWPAGTSCKSIVAFKNFLFALDIDGPSGHFENQLLWSDAAEPGAVPASWTAAAGSLAGDAILADTPGPILCAEPLRGSLMVYKRSSTYAIDFVPDLEQVFTQRTLFTSSGALTRKAVADLNGRHFVVTDGDIIITDGSSRVSVAEGRMKKALFDTLDQDNYENLFVVYHRGKNEVWVYYPEQGNQFCTKALVYDVAADSFGERDLTAVTCAAVGIVNDTASDESWDSDTGTWDSDTSAWNAANFSLAVESLVTGAGTVATMQDTTDSVSLAASLVKHDLTFDDPIRVKLVKRIHVRARAGYGTLYVRAGGRMDPSAAITWSNEVAVTEPNGIANLFATGKYISVQVRSEGGNVWILGGLDIEAEARGYH